MKGFKIGAKVVCINDSRFSKNGETVPTKDKTYTIRDMFEVNGHLVFRFEEIVNYPRQYIDIGFAECCFFSYAFKPFEYKSATSEILSKLKLIEEKADVEIKELQILN